MFRTERVIYMSDGENELGDPQHEHGDLTEYDEDGVAYVVRIDDVSGFPGTIVTDLTREDHRQAERLEVSNWVHQETGETVVVVKALDDSAMKWLYDWLEDTRHYYQENYIDASGEHDAARDMAHAVYEVMQQ